MTLNRNVAVSDSGFVFNSTTGESFSVNPIGIEIIEMLKKGISVDDINKRVFEKYNADIVTVEKDVGDFIEMLKQHSLIQTNDAA